MDTAALFSKLLPYFDTETVRRSRELSRWHMDDPQASVWLFMFREEVLIELRTLAQFHRARAVRLDERAEAMIRLIRGSNHERTGGVWL